MYISKIEFVPPEEAYPDLMEWLMKNPVNEYRYHQLLWDTFEKREDAKRSFLFREERNPHSHLPLFYMVSKERPLYDQNILSISEVKQYDPQLDEGERLSFTVRVNATVARSQGAGVRQPLRHDVWADAKKQGKEKGLKGSELVSYVTDSVQDWFISRSQKHGFSIRKDELIVEGYQSRRFQKKPHSKEIVYGTVEYQGILTVTDLDLYRKTLFEGIGRSKAFGCGMMLVRRYKSFP